MNDIDFLFGARAEKRSDWTHRRESSEKGKGQTRRKNCRKLGTYIIAPSSHCLSKTSGVTSAYRSAALVKIHQWCAGLAGNV